MITPLVIRKISPKLLFMMSFFISATAMTALGFMAYLQEYYPTSNYWNYLSWVPISMIILAVMTRSAGKVILWKSRREPFLSNRIWDLGWFWASWQYWKKSFGEIMSNFWVRFFHVFMGKKFKYSKLVRQNIAIIFFRDFASYYDKIQKRLVI